MPTVGGTKFPYTKEGMAKAKAWSEMTGKPIKATPMPKKKDQKSKAKSMPRKKGSVAKATPMKYQVGGFAEFSPGDATMTQREALKQEMMSPEYIEQIANLAMGTVGGGSKILKNLLKKPKKLTAAQKATKKEMQAGRKAKEAEDIFDIKKVDLDSDIAKQIFSKKELQKEHIRRNYAKKPQKPIPGGKNVKLPTKRPEGSGYDHDIWGTPGVDFQQGGDIPQYGLGGWLKRITNPAGAKRWWNKNIKPLGKIKLNDLNPYDNKKAKTVKKAIDPNLGFAKQRFGSENNIVDLLSSLASGKMEMGGEVPAGRRMYSMGGNTKKKRKK